MDWYCIHTIGGHEEQVRTYLENIVDDNFKFVIYKRKLKERKAGAWHYVERKLFPGYIFLQGPLTPESYHQFDKGTSNYRILENEGIWLTLNPSEIEVLGLLDKNDDGLIDMSTIYQEGDRVVVQEGALEGLEARIVSVNKRKGRVKVSLGILGENRIVELGVNILQDMVG